MYAAEDVDTGDTVALKLLLPELLKEKEPVVRFRREAQAGILLDHPHLVKVLDLGQFEGGALFLAMELIPGGSLADRVEKSGPLPLEETVRLLAGAAAGIDALHGAGLVHRDIKGANILLEGQTPYVSDFGLAKDSQASNLTRPGQALGSLDYMSPEQIRGEDVSPATDIYALGCVMFEVLTGTPPYGGRPSMRVLFAHLQEPPPDVSEARNDISAATAKAINRALEKEPEDRPASASGYIQSIARAAGI